MNKIIYLFILLLFPAGLFAQTDAETKGRVNWLTLEEAMRLNEKVQKPIIIDFYTDWCGWCKHMMKTTYSDLDLSQYINSYFYPVKFNAEGKDTIMFLGKPYAPVSEAPKTPHQFALDMLQGNLSYPTTVFLNGYDPVQKTFLLNMRAAGFLEKYKIEPMLIFTVENAYRNSNFDDFRSSFEAAFMDTTLNAKLKKMNWFSPSEAFNSQPGKKMKTLVFIHTGWCNSCKVMERTSFIDDQVFPYADTVYRFVNFNAEIRDTLHYKDLSFVNPGQPSPFHQLAMALTRNNLVLPTVALLDEDNNLMDAVPFYLPPAILKKILFYYGQDIYKSKSWAEFVKEEKP